MIGKTMNKPSIRTQNKSERLETALRSCDVMLLGCKFGSVSKEGKNSLDYLD